MFLEFVFLCFVVVLRLKHVLKSYLHFGSIVIAMLLLVWHIFVDWISSFKRSWGNVCLTDKGRLSKMGVSCGGMNVTNVCQRHAIVCVCGEMIGDRFEIILSEITCNATGMLAAFGLSYNESFGMLSILVACAVGGLGLTPCMTG